MMEPGRSLTDHLHPAPREAGGAIPDKSGVWEPQLRFKVWKPGVLMPWRRSGNMWVCYQSGKDHWLFHCSVPAFNKLEDAVPTHQGGSSSFVFLREGKKKGIFAQSCEQILIQSHKTSLMPSWPSPGVTSLRSSPISAMPCAISSLMIRLTQELLTDHNYTLVKAMLTLKSLWHPKQQKKERTLSALQSRRKSVEVNLKPKNSQRGGWYQTRQSGDIGRKCIRSGFQETASSLLSLWRISNDRSDSYFLKNDEVIFCKKKKLINKTIEINQYIWNKSRAWRGRVLTRWRDREKETVYEYPT